MSTCSFRIRWSRRSNGPSYTGVATSKAIAGEVTVATSLGSVTRVLSCIQPTGDIHLGNYIGAVRNWVSGQHEADVFHGIVDLHALTVTEEPGVVGVTTVDLAAW